MTLETWGWSEQAAVYRLYYRSREHQQAQMEAVKRHLPLAPQHLLDVGCGYGDFIDHLPDGYTYEGTEAKIQVFRGAKELHPEHKFRFTRKVTSADVIVCIAALQVKINTDPEAFVADLLGNCKLLILTTAVKHFPNLEVLDLFPAYDHYELDDDFILVVAKGRL